MPSHRERAPAKENLNQPQILRAALLTRILFGMKRAQGVANMEDVKCWNCGESCLDEPNQPDDETRVAIHFFVETKQVCRDCYLILHELDSAG